MIQSVESVFEIDYRNRPNYRTVHLGFSKSLGKLVVEYVEYVSTYEKYVLKTRSANGLFNGVFMCVCVCVCVCMRA